MEGWSMANGKFDVFKVRPRLRGQANVIPGDHGPLHPQLGCRLPSDEGASSNPFPFWLLRGLSPLSPHLGASLPLLKPFQVDSSASSYGYRVATRAVDLYETAGKGGPALAEGLRWGINQWSGRWH